MHEVLSHAPMSQQPQKVPTVQSTLSSLSSLLQPVWLLTTACLLGILIIFLSWEAISARTSPVISRFNTIQYYYCYYYYYYYD